MRQITALFVLGMLVATAFGAFQKLDDYPSEIQRALITRAREVYPRLKTDESARLVVDAMIHQMNHVNKSMAAGKLKSAVADPSFACTPYGPSASKPTSVHQLLPGDVDVVMAMGDSLTAAFGAGAGSIFSVFTEYRGMSWSIGGDNTVAKTFTLPNILKNYNPNVKGFSVGTGKTNNANSKLNVAVTGAIAQDLLSQAKELVKRLQSDTTYDIKNSWKMLTLFIGANNLCDVCTDPANNGPDAVQAGIEAALDYVKANVPRVFVNLVPVVDVTELGAVNSLWCDFLHPWLCECAVGNDAQIGQTRTAAQDMGLRLYTIRDQPKYNNADDFTIVVQPFFSDVTVPTTSDGSADLSYFAPDCFHFSQKGHANSALGLWNNLVEKVGEKKTYWRVGEATECPAPGDYLWTNKNSQ